MKRTLLTTSFLLASVVAVNAQATSPQPTATPTDPPATATQVSEAIPSNPLDATRIPPLSKVYLAPMGGFENYFATALRKKKVPLIIVANREQADFEVVGTSETKKAGWAKTIFGSGLSEETASISVINLRTGVVVFADSSHRGDALRGKRSTAEKLAKYLGIKIKEDQERSR